MNQSLNNQKDKESANEEFYQELDRKTSHRSCCTCQTLVILFVLILIITSGSVFYLYWQITHGGVFHSKTDQTVTLKEFDNKLTNVPVENKNFSLSLTADELDIVLTDGLSVDDFLLKDITSAINPNEILIYGNLIKPLNAKVLISSRPTAENGKIKLQVIKISAGNVSLPAIFNQKVSDNISLLLDKKFENFYQKYVVEQATLVQSKIIIRGKIK